MTGHDAEEFGGELYHDIVARIERGWAIWLQTINHVPDDSDQLQHLLVSLLDETMSDDDRAVDLIRQLLEGETFGDHHEPVNPLSGSVTAAREEMIRQHERLLGAVEAASQSSDELLQQVRERIGAITWMRYEERSDRLSRQLPASSD